MDVVDIQWVWGKSCFWLLTFNRTVSCPTLLNFFSVPDLGSRTHRLMLVRREPRHVATYFYCLACCPACVGSCPSMCSRRLFDCLSPPGPALLGPRSGRGRVVVLIGPVGVGRLWPPFLMPTAFNPVPAASRWWCVVLLFPSVQKSAAMTLFLWSQMRRLYCFQLIALSLMGLLLGLA